MPHTSRKKKPSRSRRFEITDENGWTRVTTINRSKMSEDSFTPKPFSPNDPDYAEPYTMKYPDGEVHSLMFGKPPEPAEGLTQEKLLEQFHSIERNWKESSSGKALEDSLKTGLSERGIRTSNAICFGLGSSSGLIRGWIDRRNVSLYQLAAFKSAIDLIAEHNGDPLQAFAQDPCFNSLDETLLLALGIQTVKHPTAFCLVTPNSFAFCPGAEQFVMQRTLLFDPAIYLGAKVETYFADNGLLRSPCISSHTIFHDSDNTDKLMDLDELEVAANGDKRRLEAVEMMRRDDSHKAEPLHYFLRDKELIRLPDLDVQDFPFYHMYLHVRKVAEGAK